MILKDWLQQAPYTLTLSSGFFSFFAHLGVLSVLEEENLLPAKLTGSSAGALVGACFASGVDTHRLKDILFGLKKEDFWDPSLGLGLLKGEKFRTILREVTQVTRLEETNIPVHISAYNASTRQTTVFTKGMIDEIIYASCAVPLLFQPIKINKVFFWDGGVTDRHGLAGTEPSERIFYHHIASRSWWRLKNSRALMIPKAHNITSLSIQGLPRVGPNRLSAGQMAFTIAQRRAREALYMPLKNQDTVLL